MRIGLFLDSLMFNYQNELLLGAHDECVRQGVHLFCFSGGRLPSQHPCGSLYDLVGPKDLDGVVISSGTIVHGDSEVILPPFVNRYASIPATTVASACEGVPSILVDNTSGVRELTMHLAKVHGRKHIACMRVDSPEGDLRFAGYRAGLEQAGLPFDPALVVLADFTLDAGLDAAHALCELRRIPFDAVVAANDWAAIGLLQGLVQRGLRVPEDVAIVGFDDIEEARFTVPPLTTIRQPTRQLGVEAVRGTLARIRGEASDVETVLPTQPCVRQSCGCFAKGTYEEIVLPAGSARGVWDLSRTRDALVARVESVSPDSDSALLEGWAQGRMRQGRRRRMSEQAAHFEPVKEISSDGLLGNAASDHERVALGQDRRKLAPARSRQRDPHS